MSQITRAVVLLMAVFVTGTPAAADPVAPGAVQFKDGSVNKSMTGGPGDSAAGKIAFVGRKLGNCLACHQTSDASDEQFHGEVGPPLDGVADRYSAPELRAIIANAKNVFGADTIMPAFYRDAGLNRPLKGFEGTTILSAQQVEDVIAYLMTLKDD